MISKCEKMNPGSIIEGSELTMGFPGVRDSGAFVDFTSCRSRKYPRCLPE
jgi:hypothetical protein